MSNAPVNLVDKSGIEKALEAWAYAPPPREPAAAPEPPPAPAPVFDQADRPALPATASPLPTLGLMALFAIAAGLALRRIVRAR